ncbi:MAG: aminomethyl-transferring glycine dehydrogenase subunit GcvPA [Chloroflexi bacterium]|nr:aminomethyl-transferring glycine dehydrogenase subunit GcvPA [Chloroflexota bacterium]
MSYSSHTEDQRRAMLDAVGVASVDELFQDIPLLFRNPRLDLPAPLSELELRRELGALAGRNANLEEYACFLGAGAYRHFIPGVVHHITGRGEFYTSYTPYQAEISQGTLQAIYEFQSLVCLLTGMDVANSGMYDGASALAEAALMACRVTGRYLVAALDTVSPNYRWVVETYLGPKGIPLEVVAQSDHTPKDAACVLVQSPNNFGYVEDLAALVAGAHEAGALAVVAVDPISLGLFRPPGDHGADIVVGEGQALGTPPTFGGPYLGLFACKQEYLRQMPGRIVGRTVDTEGREGFVLTLQTREQHIRRERATSNICTSQNLVALAATVYLATLGKSGLRQVAEQCYHKAHYAASRISRLRGYSVPLSGVFFKEFVVSCPRPPCEINEGLLERRVIGGLDISDLVPNGMLLCVTEMNTKQEIDALVESLKAIA